MSYYDYVAGREIAAKGYPFYAVIQAAMRLADTDNLALLKAAFPRQQEELVARYRAPSGVLPGEKVI